jgi:hypothetical protein
VLLARPVAREHEAERRALGLQQRVERRKQRPADGAFRREEEEQRALSLGVGTPERQRPSGPVADGDDRGGGTHRRAAALEQRPGRRHALVEHADLTHERQYDRREGDDHEPEDDVRDDQGVDHR